MEREGAEGPVRIDLVRSIYEHMFVMTLDQRRSAYSHGRDSVANLDEFIGPKA